MPDLPTFIAGLPKVELHVHHVGAASPRIVAELAARHEGTTSVPADPALLESFYDFRDFDHFIEVYQAVVDLVRKPDDLWSLIHGVGRDMAEQRIRYAELTITPQPHLARGFAPDEFCEIVEDARRRVEADFGTVLRWCFDIPGEAGLPAGLLTVLPGHGEDVGAALVRHPGVRMVSFTGGTETGRAIGGIAGQRLIPVGLELGGKSPHIVFEDADLDRAVAGVISGIFGSAGQSCVAGSRLFVQKSIYKRFMDALVERAAQVRVGLPDDPATQMGPLVSRAHRDKVASYVDIGRAEGGRVLVGGAAPTQPELAKGWFYLPTVIDGLGNQARVCQEEIFGPVLVALAFDDEEDVIRQANDTAFGLAAGMWTGDYARAWRVAREIEAGSIWINTYKQSHIATPFGGFKASGIGREKGLHGLRLYSQVKSLYWGMHEKPLGL